PPRSTLFPYTTLFRSLDNFDLRETGLTVRLSVRGDAAAASGRATAYLEQLREDEQLALFAPATFTSTPTRNPATGRMAVEFLMRSEEHTSELQSRENL